MAVVDELALGAIVAAVLWLIFRRKRRAPFVSVSDPWTVQVDASPSELASQDEEEDKAAFTAAPVEKDNWDTDWLRGRDDEIALTTAARIVYRDGAGQVTRREIDISHFYPDADAAVLTFCRLRQGTRTFRLAGISEYVDLATGEVVGDVAAHLHGLHDATPERIAELALDEHLDELAVLMFVARASGRLTPKRRASVASYMHSAEPHTDEEAIAAILPGYQVSQLEFRASLKRLANEPAALRAGLLQTVEWMRGKAADNEFVDAAISAARKALS